MPEAEGGNKEKENEEDDWEEETVQRVVMRDKSSENAVATETETEDVSSRIRIKLKYLNDDLRLVDGKLEELLGDFKRRHFSDEISSNKLVRLIFNGQVLQQDTQTLQSCGFFNDCVVHCLVHQQRSVGPEVGESHSSEGNLSTFGGRTFVNNNNNNSRDWDLSNVLIALVSFSLGSAWYFRLVYELAPGGPF